MNGLALCAGYGGLELGIERVFDEYRTVCYVEGEAFAAQHLRKKMEEGTLDQAPIWSNVRTFNGFAWRGKVDLLSGGFPCQPYSSAGNRMGKKDPRDLWPDFVRIIGEVQPGFIFLENVPRIVNERLDSIILDLDLLGYDATWGTLEASSIGAPHKRNRWFLFGVIRGIDTDADQIGRGSKQQPLWVRKFNVERLCQLDPDEERKKLWASKPSMGCLADGSAQRLDKLRLLGNGVIPAQAAYALQTLALRLAWGIVENRTPKDCR